MYVVSKASFMNRFNFLNSTTTNIKALIMTCYYATRGKHVYAPHDLLITWSFCAGPFLY